MLRRKSVVGLFGRHQLPQQALVGVMFQLQQLLSRSSKSQDME
jgi:hypothetical protein